VSIDRKWIPMMIFSWVKSTSWQRALGQNYWMYWSQGWMFECSNQLIVPEVIKVYWTIKWTCDIKTHFFINMDICNLWFMITHVFSHLPISIRTSLIVYPNNYISILWTTDDYLFILTSYNTCNSALMDPKSLIRICI
jgi:hypothetical protein